MKIISPRKAQELIKVHTNKITSDCDLIDSITISSPHGINYINIKHRLFHIAQDLSAVPTCINDNCDNLVKWDKQNQKYTNTCGYKCSNKMTAINSMKTRKKTNNDRYGGNAPSCSSKIREKMKKTNIERYGEEYTKIHNRKTKQSLMSRYGIENISQRHITNTTKLKLYDKNYLYCEHITKKQPLQIIARNLGVSDTTIGRFLRYHQIEIKRFYKSAGEIEICDFLDGLDIEYETNTKKIITPHELDIYIPKYNIAIEYNGLYWHSERSGKQSTFHLNKTELCESKGIRLIHIFEDEWRDQKQQCMDTIRHLVGKSPKGVPGRKVVIREISWALAKKFLNTYHLLKAGTSGNYRIGAFDVNDNLISVMVFGNINNEFGGSSVVELKRFVTDKKNNPGVGSKMFKYATEQKEYDRIVAFVDRRWFTGLVKQHIGFTVIGVTKPSLWWTNGKHRYHRRFMTKSQLVEEGFDSKLSKRNIMEKLNYYRIWDSGKLKLEWLNVKK